MPVRWTAVRNLHLTLQFLGDVDEKSIPGLKQILNRVSRPEVPESLHFTGFGAFPNISQPKILWLGIERSELLLRIQRQLMEDLNRNGFEPDRKPFRPHLTLGRVREGSTVTAEQTAFLQSRSEQVCVDDSPLDRIILFESLLRPGGPIYTPVYEKKLV